MTQRLIRKIGCFAFASRIVTCLLLVACCYIPNHDADVFKPPVDPEQQLSKLDKTVLKFLDGFLCWDARYFQFVASHGYIYQNSLVFLPLLPLLSHFLGAYVLWPLTYFGLSITVLTVLSGILINNVCFILSSMLFYRLSCRIMGDNTLAYKAALIFCFNPASVFFSVLYSESLYFFLTVIGMLLVDSQRMYFASVYFGLSTACRSNGVLNIVFLLFRNLRVILSNSMQVRKTRSWLALLAIFVFVFTPDFLRVAISLLPFLMFQYYSFLLFCKPSQAYGHKFFHKLLPSQNLSRALSAYGRSREYLLLGDKPVWCDKTIPFAYSSIQSEHWGVGFLKYFEVCQLPNFALATPVALIALAGIVAFVHHYRSVAKTLGLVQSAYNRIRVLRERAIVMNLAPYVLHLFVVLSFSIFTIHIQVLTRLLFSSSPCVYWIMAYALNDRTYVLEEGHNPMDVFKQLHRRSRLSHLTLREVRKKGNLLLDDLRNFLQLRVHQKLVVLYLLCYFFAGILLHGNFYPWT